MKNKKVELDLETVLRAVATWVIEAALGAAGLSLVVGHLASAGQVAGVMLLILAVYLLMPTKSDEA